MRRILVVNSSVSGAASVSRMLVDEAVQRLLEATPGAAVTHRDLGDGAVPHLTPTTVLGVRGVASTDDERTTEALSGALIAELQAADVVVIGAPMYNFSIASSLRTWFDHVLRPRVTFSYSEAGPEGLLTDKRAIVVESRGGVYSEGPAKATDFQEPYLRQLLGFIGITDVTFIHAERIGFGAEASELSISAAKARIAEVAARIASGEPAAAAIEDAPADYAMIMQTNLVRVFGERDASRRLLAIGEIYDTGAVLHEPDSSVRGHDAISDAVTTLLGNLPPDFAFTAIRPALGHNGVGRLQWRAGPPGGPIAVTGLDVARVEGGLIRSLHVFIDQPDA